MPLPKSPPYGGTAVYRCDGAWCSKECSVHRVTNDLAALARELEEGWTLRGMELFCQDCAPTIAIAGPSEMSKH
jgi:hypothetical protein